MNRGDDAESRSAWRILLTATLTPASKSTNVSSGQSCGAQRLARDQFARMGQQQKEHLPGLLLQTDEVPAVPQVTRLDVELEDAKSDDPRRPRRKHQIRPVGEPDGKRNGRGHARGEPRVYPSVQITDFAEVAG